MSVSLLTQLSSTWIPSRVVFEKVCARLQSTDPSFLPSGECGKEGEIGAEVVHGLYAVSAHAHTDVS